MFRTVFKASLDRHTVRELSPLECSRLAARAEAEFKKAVDLNPSGLIASYRLGRALHLMFSAGLDRIGQ
jgi:hypothetical protein